MYPSWRSTVCNLYFLGDLENPASKDYAEGPEEGIQEDLGGHSEKNATMTVSQETVQA